MQIKEKDTEKGRQMHMKEIHNENYKVRPNQNQPPNRVVGWQEGKATQGEGSKKVPM